MEKIKTSFVKRILVELMLGNTINVQWAMRQSPRSSKLTSRISELIKEGFPIKKKMGKAMMDYSCSNNKKLKQMYIKKYIKK
jgi:hypothetical protein